MELSEHQKKWYQSNLAIIAFLILFFPVGLFLMWKYAGWNKKIKWGITGLFVILVIINMLTSSSSQSATQAKPIKVEPTKPQPTKEEEKALDVTVENNEVAVRITNNEKEDWTDCKFDINPKIFDSGYSYKQSFFVAQDVITIPYKEFTNGDGTRFNSYTTKVQELSISCKVNDVLRFANFGLK